MKQILCLMVVVLCCGSMSYAQSSDSLLARLQQEIQQIIGQVSPSIVQIRCDVDQQKPDMIKHLQRKVRIIKRNIKGREEEVVRDMPPQPRPALHDAGIGIVLDKEGHILTGAFVKNAKRVEVVLQDGKIFDAKVKGVDMETRIAVVKIEAENLSPVVLGNSDQAKVGTFILAIGHPYGMERTASFGMISAPAPSINGQPRLPISVPIHPGDKGGAVFNIQGELIGVLDGVVRSPESVENFRLPGFDGQQIQRKVKRFSDKLRKQIEEELEFDFKGPFWDDDQPAPPPDDDEVEDAPRHDPRRDDPHDPDDGNEPKHDEFKPRDVLELWQKFVPPTPAEDRGVTLALPINMLKPIIESLKTQGKLERGWIGVRVVPVPPALKAQMPNLQTKCALQIEEIFAKSPADKAGMQKWDILVRFNGQEFDSLDHFRQLVEKSSGAVTVELIRNAQPMTVQVVVTAKK